MFCTSAECPYGDMLSEKQEQKHANLAAWRQGALRWNAFMTARNEEDMIAETISCIRNQTVKPDSIHILDDGSTDSTGTLLDSTKGVTVTHLPPHPPHLSSRDIMENRDRLMRAASVDADYVLNMDADLHIPPNYMELITSKMESDGVMVACGVDKSEPRIIPPESGLVVDARWLRSHDMLPKFPACDLAVQSLIDGYLSAMYKDIPCHNRRRVGANYDRAVWRRRGEVMRRYGVILPVILYNSARWRSLDLLLGYISYKGERLPVSFKQWFRSYHTERLKTKLGFHSWMFRKTDTALFLLPKKEISPN